MDSDDRLINVIRSRRAIYDQENRHMSPQTREREWNKYWAQLGSQLAGSSKASSTNKLVPQKRSISMSGFNNTGLEPLAKRSGPVPLSSSPTTSHPLQRQTSAPVGSFRPRTTSNCARPIAQHHMLDPLCIPQQHYNLGTAYLSTSTPAQYLRPAHLDAIHEPREVSITDYLGQSNEDFITSFSGGGECSPASLAQYTVPYHHSFTPNSIPTLSNVNTPSTATSEAMTRCDTNDVLSQGMAMVRMDSNVPALSNSCHMNATFNTVSDVEEAHMFPFPSAMLQPEFPQLPVSDNFFPTAFPFHRPQSLADSSCHKKNVASQLTLNSSHCSQPNRDHGNLGRTRHLAPRMKQDDASSRSTTSQPKVVVVQEEDGTRKEKIEITRTTRQEQPRRTKLCQFCNKQPGGFHGDHELRRHIERHHADVRKVWIIKDASESGTWLSGCKWCRNGKKYGANYNAAAHLRRVHFHPAKSKRGGRHKQNECRGGIGGGNSPSMEFLKDWMYEVYEKNVNGRVIVQNIMPGDDFGSDADAERLAFEQTCSSEGDSDLEFDSFRAAQESDSDSEHLMFPADMEIYNHQFPMPGMFPTYPLPTYPTNLSLGQYQQDPYTTIMNQQFEQYVR